MTRAPTPSERAAFHRDAMRCCEESEKRLGYRATRFRELVARSGDPTGGAFDVAIELVGRPEPSEGFVKLFAAGLQHLSLEALVVSEEFCELFPADVVAHATMRLRR